MAKFIEKINRTTVKNACNVQSDWLKKRYGCDKTEYLLFFLIAARSAGAPASRAAETAYSYKSLPTCQGFDRIPRRVRP